MRMRHLFLFIVTLFGSLMATAADYPYLVFTNTAGTTTVMSVASLTMSVSGNSLQVTNAEGTNTLTLTGLTNMQFSKDGSTVSALANVLNADCPVEVYTLNGTGAGSFPSLRLAAETLPAGAYVIKQGTNTQTVVIR